MHSNHKLIEHSWCNHDEFIEIVKKMDIGMQVSFSETYNIVAADLVNNMIPIVVSDEIKFIDECCKAKPTSCNDIIIRLHYVYSNKHNIKMFKANKRLLEANSEDCIRVWKRFFAD